ncbi:MAG: SDR family oxidoreductase [Bacteroidetes bacterium]|nr:SDR family oxidoreductase [Bacteroidota bacterium]
MAGHVIYYYLKENTPFTVIDVARGDEFFKPKYHLDVTQFDQLAVLLREESPDVVINCIGILNKDAEDNPGKAILLNSYLPHFVAKIGSEIGFKLIHISTDCVFSGTRGGYTENDFKDGIGLYAQSKALGEVTYGNNLTIRTSIVGPELKDNGIGLFDWFMKQNGMVKGYTNAFWTGVTTMELAKAVVAAIEQDTNGLQHLVYRQKISKYDLITLFNSVFKRHLQIEAYGDYHVDKSLIRTNKEFKYDVPSYQTMIEEMKEWMLDHKFLYKYQGSFR